MSLIYSAHPCFKNYFCVPAVLPIICHNSSFYSPILTTSIFTVRWVLVFCGLYLCFHSIFFFLDFSNPFSDLYLQHLFGLLLCLLSKNCKIFPLNCLCSNKINFQSCLLTINSSWSHCPSSLLCPCLVLFILFSIFYFSVVSLLF